MYCLLQGTMERRKKVHEARRPLLRQPAPPTVSMTCMSCNSRLVISSSFLCHRDIDNHVVESEWLNNRAGTPSVGGGGGSGGGHMSRGVPGGSGLHGAGAATTPVSSRRHTAPLSAGAPTPQTIPYFAEIGILLFDHLL